MSTESTKKNNDITLDSEQTYDILIIGGGPAGLNAALYSKRKGASVGIIASSIGGQVADTSSVENYLGFPSMTGVGLVEEFLNHVKGLNVPTLKDVKVDSIKTSNNSTIKEVILSNGDTFKAKSLIIATGSKPRKLNVPGEAEFSGKGVSYCAICDGPFFTDMEVIVAGGGNSAVEAAIDLSKIAKKVKLIHRSQFRADEILVNQLENIDNIEIKLNTQIQEITGDGLVEGVKVLDKSTDTESTTSGNGVFIEIGYLPNSDSFKDILEVTDQGYLVVDDYGRTNIDGVFAAGDVTTVPYKQIIISAADGAKCALAANDYLNTL